MCFGWGFVCLFAFKLLNSDFSIWAGSFRHLVALYITYTMWPTERIYILIRPVQNWEKNLFCDLMGTWYLTKQEYILNLILDHRYLCKLFQDSSSFTQSVDMKQTLEKMLGSRSGENCCNIPQKMYSWNLVYP